MTTTGRQRRRYIGQLRAPGVYFEPEDRRATPLELGRTGVPVFLGLTRRGPLDRPVRVISERHFVEIFGESLPDGYLGAAIRGFFGNGGEACYVLRIARVDGPPGEAARTAKYTVLDEGGEEALHLEAVDPGTWGNGIQVSIVPTSPSRTFITLDADRGSSTVLVKSTHGLSPGTRVLVHDENRRQWTRVRSVDGKRVTLREPLAFDFSSAALTYLVAHAFDLLVRDESRQERYENLSLSGASPRFVERIVNEHSTLLNCRATRSSTPVEMAGPMPLEPTRLMGGSDGLEGLRPHDFIGHDNGPADRRGLMSLVEHEHIDLIVMPDLMSAFERDKDFSLRGVEAVQEAAVSLCESSLNRFVLLDMPPPCDFEEARRWRRQFDTDKAALYFPWLVVLEGGRRRVVPPSGHVAGIISRLDGEVGVHKAPANAILEGVVDLDVLLRDAHLAMLNDIGINCMRPFGPRGLRVWGARTLSSDPAWRYVNVRRTVSAIMAAIDTGMQWVVFEPNDRALWKRIEREITIFLSRLRSRGMLAGETAEEAFIVRCNDETNPPENIAAGILSTDILLSVTRPLEFVIFRLTQRLESEAQASEEV